MNPFLTIAGGVVLILFGVRHLRKGLDRLFGPQLGRALQRLTRSRWHAFVAGLAVSLAAPSSTTISLLTVQTLRAGHLTCERMLAVVLGANVGLTAMVAVIALRLEQFAPLLVLLGVPLFQFTTRRTTRGVGQVLLSLGLIFLAIGIIKTAASGFSAEGDFGRLLDLAAGHPWWIALLATLLTVALQSSTAALSLVIGLGAAGTIQLPVAVAAVVGSNVGIALSMLLVGWSDGESRRLALGTLLTKGALAASLLLTLPLVVRWLDSLPGTIDKHVAVAHTGFNLLVAAMFLPLITPLDRLLQRIVPGAASDDVFGPRYVTDEPIEGLALATGQSMRELLHTAEIVREMLGDMWQAVGRSDETLARSVQKRDDQVDLLDGRIKQFLAKLSARDGEQDASGEIMRQLSYLRELETIGDVIDKNLAELAIKRARLRIQFSPEGWAELNDFYRKVRENLLIAETAFATRDRTLAAKLLRHKEHLSELERMLRDRHFARLRSSVPQSHESSAIHLDLLTHLKRVNSAVTHVAYLT